MVRGEALRYLAGISLLLAFPLLSAKEGGPVAWGKEHREARRALIKVLATHPKFREDFTEWVEKHPRQAERLVKFFGEDKDNTLRKFIKKLDKEHGEENKVLVRIEKEYPAGMEAFVEWVHSYPQAAKELVGRPALVKALEETAEERGKK